jgi:hypothetical protein
VIVGKGLGLGGIELGTLVEVVGEEPKRCRKLTAPIEAEAGAVGEASPRVVRRARSWM